MNQLLLESARGFRIRNQLMLRFSETTDLRMVPQQTSGGARWRPQYPAFRWGRYVVSGQGLTTRGELLGRQRYEAEFAFSIDPLMHSFATAMEHDVAKLQTNSAVRQGGARVRWKRDKCLCRWQRTEANARQ